MYCKHNCDKIYVKKKFLNKKNVLGENMWKFCRLCGFYTQTIDIKCACCGKTFRSRSRRGNGLRKKLAVKVTVIRQK